MIDKQFISIKQTKLNQCQRQQSLITIGGGGWKERNVTDNEDEERLNVRLVYTNKNFVNA